MKGTACVYEPEVVRAVLARRWARGPDGPPADDAELRTHAGTCEICAEASIVAMLLSEHREAALRDVHVPAAGQVWWRSAVRSHAEARQTARRRMIWLQGIVGACAVGLGAGLVGLAWPSIRLAAAWMIPFASNVQLDVPSLALLETLEPALRSSLLVALGALACLVLTPIVVYFVLSDE